MRKNPAPAVVEEPKEPFWVKCSKCRHIWIAAYAPMEMAAFARVVGKVCCPMCAAGPKLILIAKQKNGKLLEPGGASK